MTDRPILFSAPMVLALLAGRKTMTRRPANLVYNGNDKPRLEAQRFAVGDRLWVREALMEDQSQIAYAADKLEMPLTDWLWKRSKIPSIHMPKGVSRLTLIVTGVKVERLQYISEEDAVKEGIYQFKDGDFLGGYKFAVGEQEFDTAREAFAKLWDSINGKTPNKRWQSNPWVTAIEFDVIRKNIDEVEK